MNISLIDFDFCGWLKCQFLGLKTSNRMQQKSDYFIFLYEFLISLKYAKFSYGTQKLSFIGKQKIAGQV